MSCEQQLVSTVTCPSCGGEYLATALSCVDCGIPLVGAGEVLAPGTDEVGYELDDWDDAQRHQLAVQLGERSIPSRWEGTELVVQEVHAAWVETMLDGIDFPDQLAADDEVDDDAGAAHLSALYVASDVLQHDPTNAPATVELLEATSSPPPAPPYGIDADTWKEVRGRTEALATALEDDTSDDDIAAAARDLREVVRPLV
jgi:hypothetical protein